MADIVVAVHSDRAGDSAVSRFPELRPWLLTLPIAPPRRRLLLKRLGANIGRNARVHPVHVVNADWPNLSIGDDCYVGAAVVLDLADRITIGDRVTIAQGVLILTHQDAGYAQVKMKPRRRPVVIESDAFIGAGSVLLAGTRVTSGQVVPAGTIVRPSSEP